VVTTVARPHASGLLPVGIRERDCLRSLLPKTLHQLCSRITDVIAQVDADIQGVHFKTQEKVFILKTQPRFHLVILL
jgi:hypothetical protein